MTRRWWRWWRGGRRRRRWCWRRYRWCIRWYGCIPFPCHDGSRFTLRQAINQHTLTSDHCLVLRFDLPHWRHCVLGGKEWFHYHSAGREIRMSGLWLNYYVYDCPSDSPFDDQFLWFLILSPDQDLLLNPHITVTFRKIPWTTVHWCLMPLLETEIFHTCLSLLNSDQTCSRLPSSLTLVWHPDWFFLLRPQLICHSFSYIHSLTERHRG